MILLKPSQPFDGIRKCVSINEAAHDFTETITVQIFIKKRKHSCSKRAGRFNKDIDEPNRMQRNVRMVAADNTQVVYSHYFLGVFFSS